MHYLCVCIDLALLSCCSMVSKVFSWTPCSAAQKGSGKAASLFTYGNTRMQRNLLRSPRPDSSGCKRGQELRSYVQVTSLSLWGQLAFFFSSLCSLTQYKVCEDIRPLAAASIQVLVSQKRKKWEIEKL